MSGASSSSGGGASDSRSSDGGGDSDSGLELVLYRFSSAPRSRSRDRAAWKQRSQALPPMMHRARASGNSSGSGSGRRNKPSAAAAVAAVAAGTSSADAKDDDDDDDALTYDHVQRQASDGESVKESRSKVYVCVSCDQAFATKALYTEHIAAHDVSAAVTVAALHHHEALQAEAAAAAPVDPTAAQPAPPPPSQQQQQSLALVVHGIQATAAYRCDYCTGNVVGFDTLGQLGRHQYSMHLREMKSGTPPNSMPPFNPTPQHRSSTRVAPCQSAHTRADSDTDTEAARPLLDSDASNEGAVATGASPTRRRVKRTRSIFGRADKQRNGGAGGGAAGGGGGATRKRKSGALGVGGAAALEDGSAVVCGAVCNDCEMVFSHKGPKYYRHLQSHLKHKRRQSLEQEHLGPEELAQWQQREQQSLENDRSRRAGRRPLTRRGLAAMVDEGPAQEAVHVQVQLRPEKLRRSLGSSVSLDAAAATTSPPSPRVTSLRSPTQGSPVRCPKCSQSFARKASFERHVAVCKIGERNCTSDSSRSSTSGSDADDDEEEETPMRDREDDAEPLLPRPEATRGARGRYGQCPFPGCGIGLNSRTRFYVHKRTCPFNPKLQEQKDRGEECRLQGREERSDRNNIEQSSGSPDTSPDQLKQARQKSTDPPASQAPIPRPPLHRSHTEPTASSTAAAGQEQAASGGRDTPSSTRRFSPESLICKICLESFTRHSHWKRPDPFSCNRHASVHPPSGYKGSVLICPHCNAPFIHSQRYHKHVSGCKRNEANGDDAMVAAAGSADRKAAAACRKRHKRPRQRSSSSDLSGEPAMDIDGSGVAARAASHDADSSDSSLARNRTPRQRRLTPKARMSSSDDDDADAGAANRRAPPVMEPLWLGRPGLGGASSGLNPLIRSMFKSQPASPASSRSSSPLRATHATMLDYLATPGSLKSRDAAAASSASGASAADADMPVMAASVNGAASLAKPIHSRASSERGSSHAGSSSMQARTCSRCSKKWNAITDYNYNAHLAKCDGVQRAHPFQRSRVQTQLPQPADSQSDDSTSSGRLRKRHRGSSGMAPAAAMLATMATQVAPVKATLVTDDVQTPAMTPLTSSQMRATEPNFSPFEYVPPSTPALAMLGSPPLSFASVRLQSPATVASAQPASAFNSVLPLKPFALPIPHLPPSFLHQPLDYSQPAPQGWTPAAHLSGSSSWSLARSQVAEASDRAHKRRRKVAEYTGAAASSSHATSVQLQPQPQLPRPSAGPAAAASIGTEVPSAGQSRDVQSRDSPRACPICGETSSHPKSFKRHMSCHPNTAAITAFLEQQQQQQQHQAGSGSASASHAETPSPVEPLHQCLTCRAWFFHASKLTRHINSMHGVYARGTSSNGCGGP